MQKENLVKQKDESMSCRVVHLSSVHYAFDNRVFFKECASLAAAGYEVTLVAPHAEGSLTRAGVRLQALPMPRNRWERFTRTIPQVYRAALALNGDIYHFHDPELMAVGWLLKLHGKSVLYDVHEDYTGTMADKTWIPRGLRGLAALTTRMCERLLAERMNRIVAATPVIAAKFAPTKTSTVQNFPWIEELRLEGGMPYAEREPIVAYVGALSNSRGLREMAAAVALAAPATPVRLITAGKGTAGSDADLTAGTASGLVEHLGMQTRPQVKELLGRARIGIVTLYPTKNYIESQPTKLYEYMSAGLPVIASDFPLLRRVVEGARCGLLVDPLDAAAIAGAIVWLLTNPDEAEAMGRRGRQAVLDRYNWEREAASLVATYAELEKERRAG